MKKLSILFMSLVAMSTVFTSCDDEDNNSAPPAATNLELTLKNATTGAVVPNADVVLYATQEDLFTNANPIGTAQKSDANGKVTFTSLSAKTYYFRAATNQTAGCLDNIYTINNTYDTTLAEPTGDPAPIVAGKTNTFTIPLEAVGNLKITNTTANDYNVFIKATTGGTDYQPFTDITAAGGATPTLTVSLPAIAFDLKFVKIGDTSVVVEKLNNGVTACNTTEVTLP